MKNRISSFFILIILLTLYSCKISRFVVYNYPNITDYKIFPSRLVENKSERFTFEKGKIREFPKSLTINNVEYTFDDYLKKTKTVAFIIIQNDSIQYENYFNGYAEESIVASFSMAKSILSILIGCAIDESLIQSVDEPVTNYIPELKENGFDKVTIENLLQMTSGMNFKENYVNPLGDAATFYYGTNLQKSLLKMKLKANPGEKFEYVSGNSQLLGLVLERALKDKTISQYFQEKLWEPLGMEYDASWSTDRKKNGLEKTFCCINARARDFAKIGRLYLNKGEWNGKQIVSKNWVARSTEVDSLNGSAWYYQYQWWLPTKEGDFMANGILGQYIYVNPSKNLILVRLGEKEGKTNWSKIFVSIAKTY